VVRDKGDQQHHGALLQDTLLPFTDNADMSRRDAGTYMFPSKESRQFQGFSGSKQMHHGLQVHRTDED
jgi:hypothetical protein